MNLTLDDIKKEELKILIKIDEICRKNNIKYTLCGGTLLGAIRHKGFIPWDDDIDIAMTKDNYNIFLDYCLNNETELKIINNSVNEYYPYLFSKAYFDNTVLNEYWINDDKFKMGLYVDIFPVDAMGKSFKDAYRNYLKIIVDKYLLIASVWKKEVMKRDSSFPRKIIKYIFYYLSKKTNVRKKINKIESKISRIDNKSSKYCMAISGVYGKNDIFENKVYNEIIDVDFEGHKFMGMLNYDIYLTSLYGNYMELPPENKRISNHSFDVKYK